VIVRTQSPLLSWCKRGARGGAQEAEHLLWRSEVLPGTGSSHLSVILATEEAEIRKTAVQSPPGQIVPHTLFQKNPSKKQGW
jgi:hypothetical protein